MQAAWDESLVITGEDTAQVENIDDDLSRELAFYNQVCMVEANPEFLDTNITSRYVPVRVILLRPWDSSSRYFNGEAWSRSPRTDGTSSIS